ncbi:splicing factor 3B subunit 2-like [Crassostrea angulata]|uniref:splicing factor 3B subunit 2-like n=1 Tax=Magallana angulata TaxID=2784310 RepID=UPI0022B0E392|nr:splicing factor 3B subunit 2-like [Crassostrea angulata]
MESLPENIEEYKKFKVVDLKQFLSNVGLPTNGLKADLIERLYNYKVESSENVEKEKNEEEGDNVDDNVEMEEQSPSPQQPDQLEPAGEAWVPPPPDSKPPPQTAPPPPTQVLPPQPPPQQVVPEPPSPPEQSTLAPPQSAPPQPPEPKDNLDSDPDFQRKLAIQRQLISEEEQKKQKEAAALAQQAILLSQRGGSAAAPPQPPAPAPPPSGDLMEKVRQQQVMIEMEKQQSMRKMQEEAINKAEQDRRMNEAELMRQQQIALMKAQREAQEKRIQEQQQQPPPVPPMHVAPPQPPMQPGVPPPPPGLAMMPQPGAVPMNIPGQGTIPQQSVSLPPQVPMQPAPAMPTQSGIPPQVAMATPLIPPGSMVAPGMMMPGGGQPGLIPPGSQTLPVPPGTQIPVTHPPMHQAPPPPGTQPVSTQPPAQERPATTAQSDVEKLPPPQLESGSSKDIKLPQALEKVLAFKDVRAQEVGVTHEEIEQMNTPMERNVDEEDGSEDVGYGTYDMEEDEEESSKASAAKESKNKKRKKKKKKAKKNRLLQQQQNKEPDTPTEDDVQVEYVQEQLELDPTDPNYFTFTKIFDAFKITEEKKEDKADKKEELKKEDLPKKMEEDDMDDDSDDEDMVKKDEDEPHKLSKKKLKKMTRLSVAQLKQLVSRPDVVEMHDVTAQDPRLLVHLKATRNTVPVPRHWCFKRKYLQGKRGIEKPPFELPDYIKATGIMEMREALAEKEDQKNLKAKMREKVRPKMGKIDIDYQKLHDAFFRWQTKPKMTIHGDLYYEGKEFETRLKEKKPGNLSDELKTALGMPLGHNSEKFPPPWLIAMQRYGPPPSYPNLKIPGLSAPIPEGCSFGYHAGGWGKPPVDENGKPLYGDVFGTQSSEFQTPLPEEDVDKSLWGEMEEESSSEEESEEEEEDEEDASGLVTPGPEGLVTPSGITSVPMGMETPDMIELRKKRIEDAMDQGGETPALYTILPEKKAAVGGAMMGSAHVYDTTAVTASKKDKPGTEGIEVALNPEELDLDSAAMQAKYDQTMREKQNQLEKEDLSDMVAEHAAKQKKRKKQQQDSGKAAKKYKEFKF